MDSKDEKLEAHVTLAEPSIDDDGFSEAVLARLPRRRLRARTARCLSLAAAACIGFLATLLGGSPDILPLEILPAVLANSGSLMTSLLTAVAVIALFMTPFGWLVYMEMVDSERP